LELRTHVIAGMLAGVAIPTDQNAGRWTRMANTSPIDVIARPATFPGSPPHPLPEPGLFSSAPACPPACPPLGARKPPWWRSSSSTQVSWPPWAHRMRSSGTIPPGWLRNVSAAAVTTDHLGTGCRLQVGTKAAPVALGSQTRG